MKSLFKGLRARLILTYSLVTVLALMTLEIILFILLATYSQITNVDNYMSDIVSTLVPQARVYLQPEPDLAGLQVWVSNLSLKGVASLDPQGLYDSPAAQIVKNSPIYILDTQGNMIAGNDQARQIPFTPYATDVLNNAFAGNQDVHTLYTVDTNGQNWMAVPIFQKDHDLPVLGVIVLTVEPLPVRDIGDWLQLLGMGMAADVIMLLALAPFGAIFGSIFSSSLTGRLTNLTRAAQAWSQGNFAIMPALDHHNDEISVLGFQMREMAAKLNGLMEDKQSLAQIRERTRIAQELHDTVKQQNFATLMQVRAARNGFKNDPELAQTNLLEAENLIKNTQQELAMIIAQLRPPALDGRGLTVALGEYVESWSKQACIPAAFKTIGEGSLSVEIENTLYRVVQEALSNVARHSRASAVNLCLTYARDQVTMEIKDNGIGFDLATAAQAGFGMVSMQDRLKELNGRLEIRTGPEHGTQLTASIPLPALKKALPKGQND